MKTYLIKNVDCDHCARKIEEHLKKKTGAEKLSINLISNKLLIDGVDVDGKELTRLANQVEDGVKIYLETEEEIEKSVNWEIIRIISSFVFLIFGFVFDKNLFYMIGYVVVGYPVIKLALKNMTQKQFFDEYFLMAIATIAAISINQYQEALAVMLFYTIGEYVQAKTLDKTKSTITELAKLNVRNALLIKDGSTYEVDIDELQVGDLIKVVSGERIPVDCIVNSELAYVDTSHISGESVPQKLQNGEQVYGGSVNVGDELILKVYAKANDSMIAKLIDLVTYADEKKTKTEQFITRFSKVYTPIVVALALLIVIFFPLVLNVSLEDAVYRAVTLLVISCPCAFVLSVPLGYVVAIGRLAKNHILVKGSNAIDSLKKINMIAVDKTGTITTGLFAVSKFENTSNYPDSYLNSLVLSAEQNITHPIAKSLSKYANGSEILEIENLKQIAGVGLTFEYNQHLYSIEKKNTEINATVSVLKEDEQEIAMYVLNDEIKPEALKLKEKLSNLKVELLMLTGDNQSVATDVGNKLGLRASNVYAQLMPEDKLKIVENKIEEGNKVAFIGDGLNDAAVIKRSDLGIAMGSRGSEISIDSADMIISDDKVEKVVDAIKVGKYTSKIIKQNITFAFIIKILFIVLGIFGITSMWEAVFSDVGVTLIAIANSMRIKRI